MDTRILEGRRIAREIQEEAARQVEELAERGIVPGLAVVLLGDDPASQVYVRNKVRTCRELGMHSEQYALPSETRNDELLSLIDRLNADNNIDGILVQLPLPEHIEEKAVLERISPEKDVDGFHPVNVGRLVTGDYVLAPCTPMGILEMLRREGVALKGAEAVVVGRSNIVGKPMALLLLHQHATVTICHSRTRRLAEVCRRADILVVAVGRPALITREYIREGAVVVDVGTNHLENEDDVRRLFGDSSPRLARFRERGSVLVGDVHPRDPLGIAAAVTPVPGGVGPLTIAQLMKNTVLACRARRG
ncbi:MAG TPA: bifunctional methylenetetrahydrofolate dehydrogenase/methenyltetrahydrofolate cyclohydrolase FolD [Acidobacteriota bacterium]|nr:bifunctional methylenetetrahydrofolate dehydrogenase/methenyltetrahydrofolate cyclohydrolase FolD [Acidobacteriota bacterium]HRR55547.1 bifunctional methylenetetrahydrofolate dehydrogenase/methenyltetrahydrofolate cyclohydrolase FolD [Acidobacteriota bacterium]HRV06894.1 bifunctional methylenetetrahydrofolate dehydrogenase/methenyltetrahydrofolate cyclohydrolase FolD [Acidobacteriota bacterium]